MASVVARGNGNYEVRFFISKGVRRSFYVGKLPKKRARSIGLKLDDLAFCKRHSQTPDLELSGWLLALDAKDHAKLVGWGLVEPRKTVGDDSDGPGVMTLGVWVRTYIAKGARKDGTVEQLERAGVNLTTFFGEDKPIADVTPGDAEDYRVWLQTEAKQVPEGEKPEGLAHNTVRRRIGRAKEMFRAAVKRKLIPENPFADEVAAVGANVARQVFVPQDWIERCIRVAPCEDWRIILAFARYAGMRSHETRIQRWEDIDIPNRRMVVRSHKTPPTRVCPIFPELLPHLVRAREMAPEGAEFVQTRYEHNSNTGTTLNKIITKAGLVPWQKPLQNLRASRETELLARFPAKDVAAWLGNSVPVAMKHYAMAMEESFDRAMTETCKPRANLHQIPHQSGTATDSPGHLHHELHQIGELENTAKDVICGLVTVVGSQLSYPARTRT